VPDDHRGIKLGAVLAIPVVFSQAQDAAQEIKWRHDYRLALQEAKGKGLPLVIDFGTKTCTYCIMLDKTTFRDPQVVGLMNERFVPLKIDADVEVDLASKLNVVSYPTLVLAGADGRIVKTMVGYKEPREFHEILQRALASVAAPDWMQRDLQLTSKWIQEGNYARAIAALKTITDDGKGPTIQATAEKLILEIEKKGAERLIKAKELQDKGKFPEAIEALTDTIQSFAGLQAAKEASAMIQSINQSQEIQVQQRAKRARELLAQLKEFYKNREFIPCHDRCEVLVGSYGDMPEGQEASRIVTEIRNNPDWLQSAADTMSDRLGGLYLALADALLKKAQPQQAEFYLQRVIQIFPGSRQAESADIRLRQLQGTPRIQAAGPP
jgi:thioredoxin-related protein